MLTARATHPDTWCIQKGNECYQLNAQRLAFISNLEATTSQVHTMAGAVAHQLVPVVLTHSYLQRINSNLNCRQETCPSNKNAEFDHIEASNANAPTCNSGCGQLGIVMIPVDMIWVVTAKVKDPVVADMTQLLEKVLVAVNLHIVHWNSPTPSRMI